MGMLRGGLLARCRLFVWRDVSLVPLHYGSVLDGRRQMLTEPWEGGGSTDVAAEKQRGGTRLRGVELFSSSRGGDLLDRGERDWFEAGFYKNECAY